MFAPITLVQAIAFCSEKDEVFDGWGLRYCPFDSEEAARTTFEAWVQEVKGWKGPPSSIEDAVETRRAEWREIRIKQRGLGIGLWLAAGDVWEIWASDIWKLHPCDGVFSWED